MGQGLRRSVGEAGWNWPLWRGGVLSPKPESVAMVVSTIEWLKGRVENEMRDWVWGLNDQLNVSCTQ